MGFLMRNQKAGNSVFECEKKCTKFPIQQKHPSGTKAEINIFPGGGKYREFLVIKFFLKKK